ncbi:MAG: hypothetical protein MR769_07165 [Campylobacter sp.]|uniref:hypothetical protein n=1 Tax=Campylobacter sp. TaxID=205 RepID=UPI002AA72C88|nr:hypothetical protein [Campylobacter sp.]MCI6344447.1 hypothetical protein [Campylobacter sp.]
MKILSFATLLSAQTSKFITRHKDDEVFVVSPLDDELLFSAIKNHHFLKYEIDTLGFVLALVCARVLEFPEIEFPEIDQGYLSGESNASEEEIQTLCEFFSSCDGIIVAPENFSGANSANIAFMLNALSKKFDFCVVGINGKPYELNAPEKMSELEEGADFNGASVFCLPAEQVALKGSAMFATASKLKNGAKVVIDGIEATFELDSTLKGTTGLFFAPNAKYEFKKL